MHHLRWFNAQEVEVPAAKYLDIILYSREQLVKEYEAMPTAKGGADRLPNAPWGIISVKAQVRLHAWLHGWGWKCPAWRYSTCMAAWCGMRLPWGMLTSAADHMMYVTCRGQCPSPTQYRDVSPLSLSLLLLYIPRYTTLPMAHSLSYMP